MKIFNTLSRQIEELQPLEPGHIRLYTCGPTVYNYAHIGNLRAYVFEDILRRALGYFGMRVTHVMNLTDVDDKTIKGSMAGGVALSDFTRRFKDAFFEDLRTLAIMPAEYYPAATEHIPEMIALIERLMERGFAYRSNDGSIYFSIAKFPGYGKLAHLDRTGLKPGARVTQDEYDKENAADFALWKSWDPADGEVAWDSPWGRGRPGWHIECSAMSMKYLGPTFDLHTGGVDNIFPHHEDEIAQSEAATGAMFVRYWMHCAHLVVDGRKMSKSLGNVYTLRDILAMGYSGREVRYVLCSAHYRQSINFTFDALQAARASLARIDEFSAKLAERIAGKPSLEAKAVPGWALSAKAAFARSLENDLNVPESLAALFEMIREGNRALDGNALTPEEAAGAQAVIEDLDRVFAFLVPRLDRPGADVLALVEQRQSARAARNWAESDRLRHAIEQAGWIVQDTNAGPKLKRK